MDIQVLFKDLENKFEHVDEVFFLENELENSMICAATVEMDYNMYSGSWAEYFDTNVHILRLDAVTGVVEYAHYQEDASYKGCEHQNGYTYGEEGVYLADSWNQIKEEVQWQSLDNVQYDELPYDTKHLFEAFHQLMAKVS